MSTLPYQWPDDPEADRQWQREQMALRSLRISDVLSELDSLIAAEADEHRHPLYSLAAHTLDRTTMPGPAEGLWTRFTALVDHAIERLVEQRLADPTSWEVD